MTSENNSSCGCFTFVMLLFLLFLGLKLGEVGVVATWDWWWVTAPLWIYAAICSVFLVVVLFIGICVAIVATRE